MTETNEIQFEDAESYGGSGFDEKKLTFKDIVLLHVKKIGEYAAVEFRGGYWEERPIPIMNYNGTIRTYIPDSREVYSNSIEYLHDILFPYFDEEMKKASKKADEEDKKAFEDNTILKEADREDENPEQAKKYERKFGNVDNRISYRGERVKINRRLFRSLCSFLYRKKYLELGVIED